MSKGLKGFSPARKFSWNKEAELEGVWRDAFDGSAKLKVARFNNPKHAEFLRVQREQHKDLLESENAEVAQKALSEIANKGLAQFILTDWEGILDEDGNELPFSVEAAEKLLLEFDEFSDEVFKLSTETEQYRKYREAEVSKN